MILILKKQKNLKLSVVIGPHFSKYEKIKINNLKNNNVKILNDMKNILPIAKKHDMAIITSGVTKYELLSINMNFAVISENRSFYQFHKPFVKKNICYDLGYFKNFNILNKKINILIKNYEKIFQNKIQQKLVDFYGANRIIKLIRKKFN